MKQTGRPSASLARSFPDDALIYLTFPGEVCVFSRFFQPLFQPLFASASVVHIIDDGDPGFAISGTSQSSGLGGYGGDSRFSSNTAGEQGTYTWTFQVTPGRFRVSSTWVPHSNRATDAPFTVYDGSTALATVDVNQQQAPNDFSDSGASWENLGGPYDIAGTILVVQLSSAQADSFVGADAIRIERV